MLGDGSSVHIGFGVNLPGIVGNVGEFAPFSLIISTKDPIKNLEAIGSQALEEQYNSPKSTCRRPKIHRNCKQNILKDELGGMWGLPAVAYILFFPCKVINVCRLVQP